MLKNRISYLLLCSTLVFACSAGVQSEGKQEVAVAVPVAEQSLELKHIYHAPRTASEHPPVLFVMHGYGSNMKDMDWLAGQVDARLAVITVQAPNELRTNSFAWYGLTWENGSVVDYNRTQATASLNQLVAFVHGCVQEYNLDAERMYFTGFSQGAIMSLDMVLQHTDMVAGAIIMSGRLREESLKAFSDNANAQDLPVFMLHGDTDTVIPLATARAASASLKELPIDYTYKEYRGVGHSLSTQMVVDVANWITKQLDK